MLKENALRVALREKNVAVGTLAQIGSAEICEIGPRAGLDFVLIDMEHGTFGIETAANMIRAVELCGAAPIVRVPDSQPVTILKALDAGAQGVLIPNVDTAAQLQAAIRAARYPLTGNRGACPGIRANGHGVIDWEEWTAWAEKNIVVMCTVETLEGLENFEEILAVPGLDAISVGQFDLSVRLGFNGKHRDPEIAKRQKALCAQARKHGVEFLSSVFEPEFDLLTSSIRQRNEEGSRLLIMSGDRFILSDAYRRFAAAAQTALVGDIRR